MSKMNLSKMKQGDVLICTSRDGEINDFTIFAQVIENRPNEHEMTIARYMKHGKLYYGDARFEYSQVREYYRPASASEIEMFTPKHPFYKNLKSCV